MNLFNPSDRRQRHHYRAERELAYLSDAFARGTTVLSQELVRALNRGLSQEASYWRTQLQALIKEYDIIEKVRDTAHNALWPAQPVRPTPPLPIPAQPGTPVPNATQATARVGVSAYRISSAKLAQAYAYLTKHAVGKPGVVEWMLAVTGLKLPDGMFTLEDLIPVRQSAQEASGASFDMSAFRQVANTLYDHGQKLHAVLHSHPSKGVPHESGTDRHLQALLEEGGYPAIQAVFSQDGYVRFFSNQRPFTITVTGKGVEPHAAHPQVYRIIERATLPCIG